MCAVEKKTGKEKRAPFFYKRYVDDTLTIVPDIDKVNTFLEKLNSCRVSCNLPCQAGEQNAISFVGINITKRGNRLETAVPRKSSSDGLHLHYHGHGEKLTTNIPLHIAHIA